MYFTEGLYSVRFAPLAPPLLSVSLSTTGLKLKL